MSCIGFANGCHCEGCMGPDDSAPAMSDIVERLREINSPLPDEAADEITRLRNKLTVAEQCNTPTEARLRERVAHLERVQEAADAMRAQGGRHYHGTPNRHDCAMCAAQDAYDAVRKGEG